MIGFIINKAKKVGIVFNTMQTREFNIGKILKSDPQKQLSMGWGIEDKNEFLVTK